MASISLPRPQTDRVTDWVSEWVSHWVTHPATRSLSHGFTHSVTDRLPEWVINPTDDWVGQSVTQTMAESPSQWLSESFSNEILSMSLLDPPPLTQLYQLSTLNLCMNHWMNISHLLLYWYGFKVVSSLNKTQVAEGRHVHHVDILTQATQKKASLWLVSSCL